MRSFARPALAALASASLVATASAASAPNEAARAHPCAADAPRPDAVAPLRRHERSVCPAGQLVRIAGGSPSQRKLARLVALRAADPTILSVRFRAPNPDLERQGVRASELVVTSSEPRTLRGIWQAQLYAGTFLALASRYRVPLGAIDAAGSEAPVARWPHFDIYGARTTSIEVAMLGQRFLQLAEAAGATVSEYRTAATPARAIAVTLRVSNPATFLEHRTAPLLRLLDRPAVPLLGYYVGVEDARGRVVWATSRLPNEGGVFTIPRLDACSPVRHSEPLGARELPCPAK